MRRSHDINVQQSQAAQRSLVFYCGNAAYLLRC
jgi:hypothetical protein